MPIRIAFFFATLVLLASIHIVALELFLYWRFPWFDVPVHILGGACAALGYSILPLLRIRSLQSYEGVGWYLCAVMAVGVVWEVFEYAAGISVVREGNFVFDTTLDLLMDLVGGLLGYGIARSMNIFST